MKVAVIGAGIAGRMLAWRLLKLKAKLGLEITIFDKEDRNSQAACSYAAAGILSPLAELEMAEKDIYQLGTRSLELYTDWLQELPQKIYFKQTGSLVAAHGQDKVDLERFYKLVKSKLNDETNLIQKIDLGIKELDLQQLGEGLYLPTEGQIDPIELLTALDKALSSCSWYDNTEVESISARKVKTKDKIYKFDWVFDCRGLGAKKDSGLPLRAVRGELLWLKAPEVNIQHVTRLMHPRYKLYIVPRPDHVYLIGATEIESEDYSAVSVRSSLELLSAAYSLHKGFGEARIIKSVVNCRPALPDNLPLIKTDTGLSQINGLYRHGILLAPAIIEKTISQFKRLICPGSEKNYAVNA
ncbi:glycine oxidase ThiO [Kangiella sp. HZ709]|uniref:glycine oxidase ThiO n=1 Tax=Kangiella sp. HZ709 TaxID=2666328 RepID=UPI0012AFBF78|nr:glycine oxidase ThiO [Kangiella sp. HZ709]MRX27992.1 glycine oxidase ThiO [Kangiella sp. HZ709]